MAGASRAPGDVIAGRYRLVARLGAGGMGEVWHAHDSSLDEHVALKLITHTSPHAVARFRREVKLARRVVHPRCARVFDLGEDGGDVFLTMELVDGAPLGPLLAKGRLSAAAVFTVLADVCGALAAVHAAGVVHRDLKPANILVDKKGNGVVIDFGVARDLGDRSPALTKGTVGTFDFMAPEQVDAGHDVTPAADVYALGTILFGCVARRLPFVEGNEATRALARTMRDAPSLAEVAQGAPAGLVDIVDRCLARDPAKRPGLDEIHRALEDEERRVRARAALATALHEEADLDEVGGSDAVTTLDAEPLEEAAAGAPAAGPLGPEAAARVVVLPFDGDDLGPLVAEELADALAGISGLEVVPPHTVGAGVSPAAAAATWRAGHVVTGEARATDEHELDVDARLIHAKEGEVWRERFVTGAAALFGPDRALARRIAEALRVELESQRTPEVPYEAAVMYMRARHSLRRVASPGVVETIALLDECLELAPSWAPAVAARAIACARARFVATEAGSALTLEEAEAAVARALLLAPDRADTHFAAAMLAVQEARFAEGVDRLRAALAIAPTHALAMQMLGHLECEVGRVRDGIAHIRDAVRIDPTMGGALCTVARAYAMRGRLEDARRLVSRARSHSDGFDVWGSTLRLVRWGAPVQDAADLLERIGEPHDAMHAFMRAHARAVVTGDGEAFDELRNWLAAAQNVPLAPRIKSFVLQLGTEIFAGIDADEALGYLEASASVSLIDVDWLTHCPTLAPLRPSPRFAAALAIVRARAAAAWPVERTRGELEAAAAPSLA